MAIPDNSFLNQYNAARDPALQRAMFGRPGTDASRTSTAQPISSRQGIAQLAPLGNVVQPSVQPTKPIEVASKEPSIPISVVNPDVVDNGPDTSFLEQIPEIYKEDEPNEADMWFDGKSKEEQDKIFSEWETSEESKWSDFIWRKYTEVTTPEERGAVEKVEDVKAPDSTDAAFEIAAETIIPEAAREVAKEPGVTLEEVDAAKTQSQEAVNNLKAVGDADSLEALLKAVPGIDPNKSMAEYNKDAKELLGISQDEDDVPEWAAPMFLFGMNLMKGPQTSKTGQQGLQGLLGDIGEAGTVAFKEFGAERARKQKERASVASLATSLRTADIKLRGDAYNRVVKKRELEIKGLTAVAGATGTHLGKLTAALKDRETAIWRKDQNTYQKQVATATATHRKQITADALVIKKLTAAHRKNELDYARDRTENSKKRLENSNTQLKIAEQKASNNLLKLVNTEMRAATDPYTKSFLKSKDYTKVAQFESAFTDGMNKLVSAEEKEGKTQEQINQLLFEKISMPGASVLLAANAAKTIGMRPKITLDKVKIAGTDYNIDIFGLQDWIKEENTKRKDGTKLSYLGAVQDALVNPDSGAWQYILGRPEQKLIDEKQTINGVVYNTTIDDTKRKAWFAANPKPQGGESLEAYRAREREARAGWTFMGEGYKEGAPKMKQFSFQDERGVKHNLFINEEDFLRDSRKDATLSFQEMLNDPTNKKYEKYFQGNMKDFSDLGGKVSTETVYEGGKKQKIILDKRALAAAIADGTLDQWSPSYYSDIFSKGIARRIGGAIDVGENETISIVDANGNITQIKAKDAIGTYSSFATKKAEANYRTVKTSTLNLNRSLHEIKGILKATKAISATSTAADFLGSLGSLAQQLETRLGYNLKGGGSGALNKFISGMKASNIDNKRGQDNIRKAFDNFLEGDNSWAGMVIEDKVERGKIKSIFISLAFDLASAREGGKLTDNDVKNALETLGWNGTSWTQTPQEVMGRMTTAARTANENFLTNAIGRMSDKEKDELKAKIKAGEPGLIEQMLREQMDLRSNQDAGVMKLLRSSDPEASLRFDHHMELDENKEASGTAGKPAPLDKNKFFVTEDEFSEGKLAIFTPKINKAPLPLRFENIWPKLKFNGLPNSIAEMQKILANIADDSGGAITREEALEFGTYLYKNGYIKSQKGQ